MKILHLSSKNVKRLTAVEITPDGNVVIVGGKNGQGKSSVLDSIAYTLGGKDLICRQPVRRGQKKAEVTCDLGELLVRRTFTADGGGMLTVETKDGARFTSPQARLDDIVGRLSFDPLAFSRMDPAKQAETLRVLLGLDFTELDRERAGLFAVRTDVNREGKAIRARYDALPAKHEGIPADEVGAEQLLKKLETMQEQKRLGDEEATVNSFVREAAVKRAEANRVTKAAQELVDLDLAPVKAELAGLEALNRKVRENRLNDELERELEAKRAEAAALTERIEAIDAAKQEAVAKASFPVEGLGFDTDGIVTFNGLPFDQASAAEQLRVSVAIGIALNPKLRVLLIRDGSLLDEDSLRLLGEYAEKHDAQVWIERVEDGGATVIIEDGSVVGAAAEKEVAT